MKKILTFTVSILAALAAFAAGPVSLSDDDTRQAVYGALDQAKGALSSAPFGKNPIAILPMKSNHDQLIGRVKNMLVNAGFVCVEGKEDPMWDEIIKEIEWDERKSDILDPATIVKFGKLKAAKILFQCEVRVVDKNDTRVYAEVEMRATDIATKQVLWGNTFAYRYYIGKDVSGIIRLNTHLCNLLKKSFAEAGKSLAYPDVAGKLDHIKNIVVVPLSGDIDSYMTGLAIEMLTQTRFSPMNPHIPSLAQVRSTARDGLLKTDAVFYGSVRSLHKTRPVESKVAKKIVIKYDIVAQIQVFIEDAKTGSILWSKTVPLKETVTDFRDMTSEELKEYRQEKIDTIPDEIAEDVIDNWKHYLSIIGIVVGVIVALIVIVIGIKAFASYNNVR